MLHGNGSGGECEGVVVILAIEARPYLLNGMCLLSEVTVNQSNKYGKPVDLVIQLYHDEFSVIPTLFQHLDGLSTRIFHSPVGNTARRKGMFTT